MGENVDFASNGSTASGYLATPASGAGPGVIVIQEWWGLVPQIKRVCDRLAAEGYTALAPDLFHGEMAQHDEMDRARHLLETLPHDRAARDMGGAIDALLGHQAVRGEAVGVIGFCMGGMLAFTLAAHQGPKVAATVSYYGAPLGNEPDWSNLTSPVVAHIAGEDGFFPPDGVAELCSRLRSMGRDVTAYVYPGTGHAFGNEENALGTYDEQATALAWSRTLAFLRSRLH